MSHGCYSLHSAFTPAKNEEDRKDYVKGGYHPVEIGDSFSDDRYVVVRKLGWKHNFTMWLVKDQKMHRHVALRIMKSAPRYTEFALDDIKIHQRLITSSTPRTLPFNTNLNPPYPSHTHPGCSHVISFLDHFRHKGPNGTHVCMVFEVLGEDLLGLMQRHSKKGVPMHIVRQIAKQVLLGLDYMHRWCGVIHTNIKPENILICIDDVEAIIQSELATSNANAAFPPTEIGGVPPSKGRSPLSSSRSIFLSRKARLSSMGVERKDGDEADSGRNPVMKTDSKQDAFTDQELEEAKKAEWADAHASSSSLSVDRQNTTESSTSSPPDGNGRITVKIANLERAQLVGHHAMDLIQTQQYRCPEVILGAAWSTSADIWSVACVIFELITVEILFDPAPGSLFSIDDDHIAQIMGLMGDIPKTIMFSGKYSSNFFNHMGKLRYISKPRYRPLNAVLRKKYIFSKTDADALASFLTPMLCLHPDKRAKASELIRHNWLDGVLVQGGVDITGQEYARLSGLNESEVDAVDDVVVSGDEEGSREHSPLSPHRPRTPTFVPSPAKTKGNVYAPWRSPVTSKHSRKHSRSGTPNSDDSSNSAESRHSSASSISMRSRGV